MSSTVYDITFTICVTSHNACSSDITQSIFMTYPLIWHHTQCYDNTTIVYLHSHYVLYHTNCICVITHSGSYLSNAVCV